MRGMRFQIDFTCRGRRQGNGRWEEGGPGRGRCKKRKRYKEVVLRRKGEGEEMATRMDRPAELRRRAPRRPTALADLAD